MTNNEIAQIFYKIAELLSLKGDNPFKVRAYEKSARIIENLDKEIFKIKDIKELEKIQGVGKSIAECIIEIQNTGTCSKLEDLKKEMPDELIELTQIQGLGPKKAAYLYKELNIKDIDTLEKFARDGRLRVLPGFGEKSEKNILEGVEIKRSFIGKIPQGKALFIALEIIDYLKEKNDIRYISEAGSLRRRKETVGDIDIIAACKDADAVIKDFTAFKNVKKVLAKGDTKASIIMLDNIQADLRIVDEDSYGAALQYFTGSKEHNVILRGYSEKLGLKINEYGVYENKTEKKVAGKNEEDVYTVCGLQYIPPEIREGTDEI